MRLFIFQNPLSSSLPIHHRSFPSASERFSAPDALLFLALSRTGRWRLVLATHLEPHYQSGATPGSQKTVLGRCTTRPGFLILEQTWLRVGLLYAAAGNVERLSVDFYSYELPSQSDTRYAGSSGAHVRI